MGTLLLIILLVLLLRRCINWLWLRTPTLSEYLARHQACQREGEAGCYRCGTFYPLSARAADLRCKTLCRHCKTVLWRSER
ncbi:MAG: hypothetical protein ACRCU9_04940 [Iodobacter sp.]